MRRQSGAIGIVCLFALASCERVSGLGDLQFVEPSAGGSGGEAEDASANGGEGGTSGEGGNGGGANKGGNGGAGGGGGTGGAIAGGGSGGVSVGGAGSGGGGEGGQGGLGGSGTGGGGAGGAQPYGSVSVDFSTNFILDGTQFLSEEAYTNAHLNDVSPVAFTGTYTSSAKPLVEGGLDCFSAALHTPQEGTSPPAMTVIQQCSDETSAQVMLQFATDDLATGPAKVGFSGYADALLAVLAYKGSYPCVAAVGQGSVNITTAVNTTSADGGQLALAGSDIVLYHPTSTPYGDITGQLNMTVCPWE